MCRFSVTIWVSFGYTKPSATPWKWGLGQSQKHRRTFSPWRGSLTENTSLNSVATKDSSLIYVLLDVNNFIMTVKRFYYPTGCKIFLFRHATAFHPMMSSKIIWMSTVRAVRLLHIHMGDRRSVLKDLLGQNLRERGHLGDPGLDGMIILRWIFR